MLENGQERAVEWLKENCKVNDEGAGQLIEYIEQGKAVLSESPQIILSAVDPLNLVGIIVPGERTPAISRKKILLV